MSKNPAQSLSPKDRLIEVAEEQAVGGHFEGESKREWKAGKDMEVSVDIFKRSDMSNSTRPGTYFLRVSLRRPPMIGQLPFISRYEIDIEKTHTQRELMAEAFIGGGALAVRQIQHWKVNWDPDHIAKVAQDAMKELLMDLDIF